MAPIISRGDGALALYIPFVIWIAAVLVTEHYVEKDFILRSTWAAPLTFAISGLIVILVGRKLNSKPPRVLLDPETYEEVILEEKHTCFWIPMQYWGYLYLLLALVFYGRGKGWF